MSIKTTKISATVGEPRRSSIQSVEIGMTVLDALVQLGAPAPLSVVAQASGLAAPQAHRYLGSLINAGMARQDVATGRYAIGPAALRLGLSALALTDVYRVSDEGIRAFSDETGATVLIAALGPTGPTVVRWHAGSPPVVTSLSVGSSLPMLRSATGHAFLAFLPARETEAIVAREQAMEGLNVVDVDQLRSKVRVQGYGRIENTLIPGLRATAVPVLDLQGRATLVATLLTAGAHVKKAEAAMRDRLRETCGQISAAIGGRPPA